MDVFDFGGKGHFLFAPPKAPHYCSLENKESQDFFNGFPCRFDDLPDYLPAVLRNGGLQRHLILAEYFLIFEMEFIAIRGEQFYPAVVLGICLLVILRPGWQT